MVCPILYRSLKTKETGFVQRSNVLKEPEKYSGNVADFCLLQVGSGALIEVGEVPQQVARIV